MMKQLIMTTIDDLLSFTGIQQCPVIGDHLLKADVIVIDIDIEHISANHVRGGDHVRRR
jgi:hypothetical protein